MARIISYKERFDIKSFDKILWLCPLAVIIAQLLTIEYLLPIGIILFAVGLTKKFRATLLLGFMVLGHIVWLLVSGYLTTITSNVALLTVLARFGLFGYILLFGLWAYFQPCENNYLQIGDRKAIIRFPFVWRGFKEYVWRFVLIFCALCLAAAVFFSVISIRNNDLTIMLYGIAFAAINSVLEELLWRGFILGRAVDFLGEKQALILTSLAFGFYHLSLGFSVWICLAFAIGGFYMGGCAVKSNGLCAPIIMHFFVNMVFVSIGIIF